MPASRTWRLNRLAYARHVGDGDSPGVVASDHVPDEEVAAVERLLVFVDDPADMETFVHEVLVFGREAPS